ncbi:hypothetical protein A3Q56_01465 [Intoshia linei]|uniref:Adenylate kinase 7 n=1 Tax=Intoshia linei TaxID=1819745 RepID=A0A177B8Z1_9BILA|nr:hypothetical protein A3Q56_01465 [Intoshia linei]
MKPKNKYIVAVDESNVTLEEIVRTVSKNLGNGSVKKINKEEALLMKSLKQADYDQLLINCRIDASYINENMQIRWHCDTGIVENIEKVVKEYRNSRDLLPIRVYINGPPSSGKTSITEKLCEHYKIHHIKIKDVILETIDNLKLSAARLEKVDNDEDPDQDTRAQEDSDLLESALANMDDNNGRLDDSFVIQFLKRKLKSAPCQNQGFILDGYPKIISQSKSLFEPDDSDVEEEQGRKGNISYDESIMAQHIFCLESQDNFLRERIMNLPETVVAGSHNTEAGFTRRLLQYKQTNTDEDTIFNYFDEIELHASTFDVSKDESINNQLTIDKMIKIIGKCKNYGLTLEELEKLRLEEMDKLRIQKAEQEAEMERIEFDENEKRAKNQKEWAKLLKDVRREEYELLEQRSLPLRNYLMENVMPTLLQAMRACSEVRPDDPIDYVAEYLFQNNPEAD